MPLIQYGLDPLRTVPVPPAIGLRLAGEPPNATLYVGDSSGHDVVLARYLKKPRQPRRPLRRSRYGERRPSFEHRMSWSSARQSWVSVWSIAIRTQRIHSEATRSMWRALGTR
jgi:hypothetical protein